MNKWNNKFRYQVCILLVIYTEKERLLLYKWQTASKEPESVTILQGCPNNGQKVGSSDLDTQILCNKFIKAYQTS